MVCIKLTNLNRKNQPLKHTFKDPSGGNNFKSNAWKAEAGGSM